MFISLFNQLTSRNREGGGNDAFYIILYEIEHNSFSFGRKLQSSIFSVDYDDNDNDEGLTIPFMKY